MMNIILNLITILHLTPIALCINPLSPVTNTLYFNSYHQPLEHLDSNIVFHTTNIHITWSDITSSFIINNDIQLNWDKDNDWNEISYIYNTENAINSKPKPTRRLLTEEEDEYTSWNKWDHTTEHHKKEGRFIGESKYKRRFSDASAMCHEYYAELASIPNAMENEQVTKLCKSLGGGSCWIGLRKQAKKTWSDTKKWLDGHLFGYTNWAPGSNNNNAAESCAEIYTNGLWNDADCNRERYAICEQVTEHRVGGFIGVEKKASWYKGNLYCKMKYGSELATITQKYQQKFVKEACGANIPGFDGENCWIGFKKNYGILWGWTGNNDIAAFTNWGLNQPQNIQHKDCAYMNVKTTYGVWENDECSKQNWIVCNAQEQTPKSYLKNLLFPPSNRDMRQKEKVAERMEEVEVAEKQMEKQVAQMRKYGLTQDHPVTRYDNKIPEEMMQKQYQLQLARRQNRGLTQDRYDSNNEIQYLKAALQSRIPPNYRPNAPQMHIFPSNDDLKHKLQIAQKRYENDKGLFQAQRSRNVRRKKRMKRRTKLAQRKASNKGKRGAPHSAVTQMLSALLRSLSPQRTSLPSLTSLNLDAISNIDVKGYDPHKDPYFGDMNLGFMNAMKQSKTPKHEQLHDLSAIKQQVLKHGGSLQPPSGDPNDPYGYKFNPRYYPGTQLTAPFASAAHDVYDTQDEEHKRMLLEVMFDEVEKCKDLGEFVFCVRYNARDARMIAVEIVVPDVVSLDKGINAEHVEYWEQIEFLFEFNPYKMSHILCHNKDNNDGFDICLEKNNEIDTSIRLFVDGSNVFDFVNDDEWDEIYENMDKKCVYLLDAKICMMPIVDLHDYLVQVKFHNPSTNYLEM